MLYVLSLCRVRVFAERLALGKDVLYRERAFAERLPLPRARPSTKKSLSSAIVAKGPALGKGGLCRAPDE